MQIEMRLLTEITPYSDNPRDNDAAVEAVAASIREFGFNQPIVVDAADIIVVGHTRYKAAQKLGLERVPVHVAHDLTPVQARAYRIADNQTATMATWDEGKLVLELAALQGMDFDLSLTGFSSDDLDRLLGEPNATGGAGDLDAVPDPPADPVTKSGDLWLLGGHRLLCGDATNPADVERLMEGSPADLLLTDPPYNVAYEGATTDRLTIANDDLDEPAYQRFLVAALSAAKPHLRPGGAFYVWHADLHGLTVRAACVEARLEVRQCLVWAKSSFTLGRQDYQWKHEPCLYGWAEGAAHTWLGDRSQTTVLEFDKPARNADHPTTKPVELFAYLVGNSCPKGGVVLDPFAGSGTALIAAHQIGRGGPCPRTRSPVLRRDRSPLGDANRADRGAHRGPVT